jgi:hypothetical protein
VDVHAGVMGSGEEAVEEEGGMGTDELVVRRRGGGGGAGMGWDGDGDGHSSSLCAMTYVVLPSEKDGWPKIDHQLQA